MKPYYEDGAVTVFHGDCREVLPTIERVDHVITDPPYEVEAHTTGRRQKGLTSSGGYREVLEAPIPFEPMTDELRSWVSEHIGRAAQRWVLVFCQIEASMAWRRDLEDAGLVYKRSCVWVKPDGQPQLSGDRPGMGYETIVTAHRPGRSRWNGGGKTGVFVRNKGEGNGKQPHPTTKPLVLMTELVSLFTDEGELILDPFAGSRTTGVAAKALGRRAVLIEQSEEYCEVIVKRLAQESFFSVARQRMKQVALPLGGEE